MSEVHDIRFRGRQFLVLAVMGLLAGALLWQAVDLQLSHQGFLQRQGTARHLRSVKIPAHRGMILDRHGEPLAISTPVKSVWAHPRELLASTPDWRQLARLLDREPKRLQRLVESRQQREFIYLKRHVEPVLAGKLKSLKLPGIYLQREYRRYYPAAEGAAHVVGFTNVDDQGQEGLELAFDEWLRGVDGRKQVIRDRLGRAVEEVARIAAPRPGRDLVLSMDLRIQSLAYRALKTAVQRHRARAGSLVLLDVTSGEVLAMVNQPSYNPNNGAERVSARFRNRAVTDVFEPGSTLKPLTILSALESGLYQPSSVIDTAPGHFMVGRYTVKDHRNYGPLSVAEVIKKSSNVGASRIALNIPSEQLWQNFALMGLGEVPGSAFPGEAAGRFSHFSTWGEIEQATLAFGYGLSVSTLQLARIYAAIGNGGVMPELSFQRRDGVVPSRSVVAPEISRQVVSILEGVVAPGGTGGRARVAGYRIAGKTGTVRKSADGGYSDNRYLAIFAGLAPASRPRLAAVVTIDEPAGDEYYGGQVAAPVFSKLMAGALRLLGVAPDEQATVLAVNGQLLSSPPAGTSMH